MASPVISRSDTGVNGLRKPRSNFRKVFKPKNNVSAENNSSSEVVNCVERPADLDAELTSLQDKMLKLTIDKERLVEELGGKKLELHNKNREQKHLLQQMKKLQSLAEMGPTNVAIDKKLIMKEQKKKKKALTMVKRPLPPFILWCKDEWKEAKKEYSEADSIDIRNMMVTKWKTISDEVKMQYDEKYKAQKEAFLEMIDEEKRESEAAKLSQREQKHQSAIDYVEQYFYFKENNKRSKERRQKKKKEIDANKPKRPGSAFMLFSKEERKNLYFENPGLSFHDINTAMTAKWKELKAEDKKMWYDLAAHAMKCYKMEIELYYKEAQAVPDVKAQPVFS